MTGLPFEPNAPDENAPDIPLEPWMLSMARAVTDVDADAIPREMMWARLQHRRATQSSMPGTPYSAPASAPVSATDVVSIETARQRVAVSGRRAWVLRAAGIAAVLVGGIGVGRYLLPSTGPSQYQLAGATAAASADSVAALGLGPDALAALPRSSDPARVAMEEHLARTVALLTTVRDEDPSTAPVGDLDGWARELLGTTRLLQDEPQLRDERTRRLLQDLELVLVQIIQARKSAPETNRAPGETMRETNLLPRVRAAVTAASRGEEPTLGGGL
jgi:hypothetical protein